MKEKPDLSMHYGAKGKLFQFAKEMRKNPTESERALWKILNSAQFSEHKFRRQHPIAKFIADFYSHNLKLVIEVDGGYHETGEQTEYDNFRDEDMSGFSISVLRFTNHEVLFDSSDVITKISSQIASLKQQ